VACWEQLEEKQPRAKSGSFTGPKKVLSTVSTCLENLEFVVADGLT
jgi:hypothetical protein